MVILSLEKGIVVFEKVSKILHPKIWTNPATRVLTFYHGGLAGTPQPLGNNSSSKFIMEICKARLHFSGGSRGGARGVSTKPRSEGPKNFFERPPPAPLSNGLDDRPQIINKWNVRYWFNENLVNVLGQTICDSLVLWKVTPVYVGFRITGVESNICWFSFLPTFPIINKTDGPKMKR